MAAAAALFIALIATPAFAEPAWPDPCPSEIQLSPIEDDPAEVGYNDAWHLSHPKSVAAFLEVFNALSPVTSLEADRVVIMTSPRFPMFRLFIASGDCVVYEDRGSVRGFMRVFSAVVHLFKAAGETDPGPSGISKTGLPI